MMASGALTTDGKPIPVRKHRGGPHRTRRWSMRAHLVVVAATIMVAIPVAVAMVSSRGFGRSRHNGERLAQFEARVAAVEVTDSIPELKALMARSANALGAATGGKLTPPPRCDLSFGAFRIFTKGILHIVLPDGSVACSSAPPPGTKLVAQGRPYATESWLTQAVKPGAATSATGPIHDEVSDHTSLIVAAPVPGAGPTAGKTVGVLALELDLQGLAPDLAQRFAESDAVEYLITDKKGATVASRSVHPALWAGKALEGSPFRDVTPRHAGRLRDLDGTARVYGRFGVGSDLDWQVFAGVSTASTEDAARATQDDLVQAATVLAALLMLVTLSGILTVKRR